MSISTSSVIGSKMRFKLCSNMTNKKRQQSFIRQGTKWSTAGLTPVNSNPSHLPTPFTPISLRTLRRVNRLENTLWARHRERSGRNTEMKPLLQHSGVITRWTTRTLMRLFKSNQVRFHQHGETNALRTKTTTIKTRLTGCSLRVRLHSASTRLLAALMEVEIMRRGFRT